MLNFLKNGPWGNEKKNETLSAFQQAMQAGDETGKMKILHKKIDADMICIISDL